MAGSRCQRSDGEVFASVGKSAIATKGLDLRWLQIMLLAFAKAPRRGAS